MIRKITLEKSLVMIKPDGIGRSREILKQLDSLGGSRILSARIKPVPLDFIRKLYASHTEKEFYEPYINSFKDGAIDLAIYKGENDK